MTAITADEYDNRGNRECDFRSAILLGGKNYTYTPTNSSGKTIRVINCWEETYGGVVCTESAGVLTIDTGGLGAVSGATYHLIYTLI